MSCTVAWSCIVVCFWYHLSASNDYHVFGIEAYFSTQWHNVGIRLVLRLFVHSTKDLFVRDAAFGSSQGADPVLELQAIEAPVPEKYQERKLEKPNPMQLMFGKDMAFDQFSNCRYTAAREVLVSVIRWFNASRWSYVPLCPIKLAPFFGFLLLLHSPTPIVGCFWLTLLVFSDQNQILQWLSWKVKQVRLRLNAMVCFHVD